MKNLRGIVNNALLMAMPNVNDMNKETIQYTFEILFVKKKKKYFAILW